MSHKQKVLDLLSDGEPHSHMAGYRLGVMLHSRVADLRRDGHVIECWRDGDLYMYRLVSLEAATVSPPSAGVSPPVAASSESSNPPVGTHGVLETTRDGDSLPVQLEIGAAA